MPLRVLLVEDSENDALLLLRELKKAGHKVVHERVDTASEMRAALAREHWDLVLSDFVMPQFGGLEALRIFKATGQDIPFILVSGKVGEDAAVAAMKAGAHDYIMKTNLKRLAPAVERELAEAENRRRRRQAEKALREMDILRIIMENTSAQIAYLDTNFNFVEVNSAYARGSGYSVAGLIGENHFVLFPNEENQAIFERVRDTGEVVHFFDKPFSFPGDPERGVTYWDWTLVPVKDASGKVQGLVFSLVETTERVRAEQKQRESEKKAQRLLESSIIGVIIAGMEGSVLEANDAFLDMVGYTREELLRGEVNWQKMTPPDYELADGLAMQQLFTTGECVPFEKEYVRKDGSLVPVLIGASLLDTGGPSPTWVCFIIDITERKGMEEELSQHLGREKGLREDLEAEIKRRAEFIRAAVHELKTPVTAMLASSDILLSELRDPTMLRVATNINRGAISLNRRIDELLDVARGEVGMLQLKLAYLEPAGLLNWAYQYMAPVAASRQQTLALELPPSLSLMQGDEQRLQQVVLNLLSNACKYTQRGGQITLRARETGSSIVVEVEDNGPGIPPEEQSKLFSPYYRLERDGHGMDGLGLGLNLCKRLVELHGGQIWLNSVVGQGSTFGFSVPLPVAHKEEVSKGGYQA